jgi:hypothetical protein
MERSQISEDENFGTFEAGPSMNLSEKEFGVIDEFCLLIPAIARIGATITESPRIKPIRE